jgi:cardiolipin synthase
MKPEAQPRIVTWANGITLLRILCLPLLVYLVVAAAFGLAFVLLWVLAVSDLADGYLARKLNQVTHIGTFIDPLTDRITIITIVLTLAVTGIMPWWLGAAILARDVILGAVIGTIYRRAISRGRAPIPVTQTGKVATMAMFVGVPGFLLHKTGFDSLWLVRYGPYLLTIFGVLLYYISLSQYIRTSFSREKISIDAQPGTREQ